MNPSSEGCRRRAGPAPGRDGSRPRRRAHRDDHAARDAIGWERLESVDPERLSWPDLDADFTIMSLLQGIYGGRKWMSELARHAGAATSEAKAIAARINGAKGGRPRKAARRTRARQQVTTT